MTTAAVDFSEDQRLAVEAVLAWRDRASVGGEQFFTMGGYAGTGKSTVVAHLAELWSGVAAVALAGKAAHVLRQKGLADASTIHSLIYEPVDNGRGRVTFRLRDYLPGVEVIVPDEASMIDRKLHEDLLSFDLPVLYVGDHGQLEPIGDNPHLMKSPRVRLEHIHRQAAGNPILRLSAAFREGKPTPYWSDPAGRLRLVPRADFWRHVRADVQVICGFNKTRHAVNRKVREALGVDRWLVAPGDRLIVLRNNYQYGVFNGQMVAVKSVLAELPGTVELEVEADDGRLLMVPACRWQFGENLIEDWRDPGVLLADYAYGITCHKSQGSEFDDVLVRDEVAPAWDARRWRYTAATRARSRLTYCL